MSKGLKLNILDIKRDINLDMYVLNFPRELFEIISEKKDTKNLNISKLNLIIESLIDGCYTSYVNANNLDNGWVFSYSDKNLDNIKHYLTSWAIDNDIEKETILGAVDNMCYRQSKINIDHKEITAPKTNYLKKNLLLFHIANVLSGKIKYTLKDFSGNDTELTFNKVNQYTGKGKVRLISDVLDASITITTKKKEKKRINRFYSYYIDLSIENIYSEDVPKLFINSGLIRYKVKEDGYKTRGKKGILPYIKVKKDIQNNDNECSFVRGKIMPYSYKWDKLFETCFNYTYKLLPSTKDIFSNPINYIKDSEIKVYIPQGTHFWDAKHDVFQGADLFFRKEIAEEVKNTLTSRLSLFLDSDFIYIETEERSSRLKNKHTVLDEITLDCDFINLEVYYLNKEFKIEFSKFIDAYNNGLLTIEADKSLSKEEKKIHKEMKNPIIEASEKLLEVIQKADYNNHKKNKSQKMNVKYKINVNYINLKEDLRFNLEVEDKLKKFNQTNAKIKDEDKDEEKIKAEKERIIKIMDREMGRNKRCFSKIKEEKAPVPAIIEFPDAEYFNKNNLVDSKKYLRHLMTTKGRITQFFANGISTNADNLIEKSNYNRMQKCVLECFRMRGINIVDVDFVMNKVKPDDNVAIMGVYMIPGTEEFIMVSLYNKKIYGYMVDVTGNWVNYSELLIKMGSRDESSKDKGKHKKPDCIENAILKFIEISGANHVIIITNRSSIKAKIPYFGAMTGKVNFCVKYKEQGEDINLMPLPENILNKLSIVAIDEEQSGICPEWVSVIDREEEVTSLPNPFCQLNENVYYGVAPKTNTSDMKSLCKTRKEERLNKIYRKETAIAYSVPVVKEGYDKKFIARISHNLRGNASYQYSENEFTVFPYTLHLAYKAKEYYFKKSEMYFNDDTIDEMDEDEIKLINSLDETETIKENYEAIECYGTNILDDLINLTIDEI